MPQKLDEWYLEYAQTDPYKEPHIVLKGKVYDSRRFNDGDTIQTSRVVKLSLTQVETLSGSVYILGEPDQEYEAAYPNAKQRLVDAFNSK